MYTEDLFAPLQVGIADGHLPIEPAWPEQRGVTIDVYVCNFGADHSAKAKGLMAALESLFLPGRAERHSLWRGQIGAVAA